MPQEEGGVGTGRGCADGLPEDASDGRETPGAPTTRRHTSRVVAKPVHYSQEQEKEAAEKISKKNNKSSKSKELNMAELQSVLQHLVESNGALQQQVVQMSHEIVKREQEV